ncbi:UNVERIFIED_CONTAM: hypothetical protein RMT77_011500 [Armadillidium vulgare]
MALEKFKIRKGKNNDITGYISTYLMQSLFHSNFDQTLRHIKKNIMEKDNVLFDINNVYGSTSIGNARLGQHWMLLDINFNEKEIRCFNSFSEIKIPKTVIETIKNLIYAIHVANDSPIEINKYKFSNVDTPQQKK